MRLSAFTLAADAVPKGRPRVTRRGIAYTPKRTKDFEGIVRLAARAATPSPPWDGPVALRIMYRPRTRRRSDVDNVAKAIMDALIGVVYVDDSQVRALSVTRLDPGEPMIEVMAEAHA